jgi:shikimate 5-dehydrogenase
VKEVFGNRAGALPLTGSLTTTGGRLLITVSGSCYRGLAGPGTLGFDVTIDGTPVGALNGYTNEPGSHRTIPARTLVIPDLIAGNHEIKLMAQAETSTDGNDYFHLTALELSK